MKLWLKASLIRDEDGKSLSSTGPRRAVHIVVVSDAVLASSPPLWPHAAHIAVDGDGTVAPHTQTQQWLNEVVWRQRMASRFRYVSQC